MRIATNSLCKTGFSARCELNKDRINWFIICTRTQIQTHFVHALEFVLSLIAILQTADTFCVFNCSQLNYIAQLGGAIFSGAHICLGCQLVLLSDV